jgi:hypothetical protein
MAGPRLFYSIERRGHRDGYCMPDVDLELPRDGTVPVGDDERAGLPGELESGFDVENVLRRWRGYTPVSFLFPFLFISGFLSVGFGV